jgi:hypothetical protein
MGVQVVNSQKWHFLARAEMTAAPGIPAHAVGRLEEAYTAGAIRGKNNKEGWKRKQQA